MLIVIIAHNNNNSNNTEDLDRLMVLVSGKHAQNIGFSEEVEMIGELQIMPSSVIEARRSVTGRNRGYMFAAEAEWKISENILCQAH